MKEIVKCQVALCVAILGIIFKNLLSSKTTEFKLLDIYLNVFCDFIPRQWNLYGKIAPR